MLAAKRRGTTPRPSVRMGIVVTALLLSSAAVVVSHVSAYTTLSPIDELQHIDYVVKAGQLDVVRSGEKVGETAMREQSCRGIDSPGFVSPPCDARLLTPEMYQEGGYNTASVHPPTYYAVTGLLARAVVALPGIDSLVTGARLVGAVWLSLGLIMTFLLGRALGASLLAASMGSLVLGTLPVVLLPSATVTPDATNLFCGAAVCLATVLHLQRRVGLRTVMVGAVTATAFKSTGVLAVGVCLLLVAVTARAWQRSSWQAGARQWLSALSALVVGGAAPVVLWTLLTPLFALDVPPSPMSRFNVSSLGRDQVLGNLLALAPPTQSPYLAPVLRTTLVMALIGLGGYLVLGAVAAVSLSRTGEPIVDRLGGCTLVAMLVGGPLLVLLTYVVAGAYVPIPPRYGLVLLPPAIAVLTVLATRHRVTFVVATAIGVAQLVAYTQAIA